MSPSALLDTLRARGVRVWPDGDALEIRAPAGTLTPEIVSALRERKPALLALLRSEVAWRVLAMRRQATASGSLPLLLARSVSPASGQCASCGEPSAEFRCSLCTEAARQVIAELRHGGLQ